MQPGPLDRFAFAARNTMRAAWYTAHYAAGRAVAGSTARPGEPRFASRRELPSFPRLLAEMRRLYDQDWANIAAGLYPAPAQTTGPRDWLRQSLLYFRDVRRVARRRREHGHSEVLNEDRRRAYPRYYLQNFHYQTGGWFEAESAARYDFQVEALFGGAADAMRRQALPAIGRAIAGRNQRDVRLLDVAAGTGRFLAQVKDAFPRLAVTALDLSPAYTARARHTLARWRGTAVLQAPAEAMPLADGSQHIVTCIYLFHELPPKVRVAVAAEIARVLAQDGTFIFVDSIQKGDVADFDPLLDLFPVAVHEPYYGSYATTDVAALFGAAGLTLRETIPAYLSKVMVFAKG